MKILFCVLYYEPAWAYGGPPRATFDLARELVRRGHEVTVCTTDVLDRNSRISSLEETSHGVRVVRFPNLSNRLAFVMKVFLPMGMEKWLAKNIASYDVAHLFDARTMPNAWASEHALRAHVPFVVSVWGSLPRGRGWRAWIKAHYDREHLPRQLGHAAALLAQNEHEAALYAEHGGDACRTQLWPLGVDANDFKELPVRGAFRAAHGISSGERIVLFVGRVHELKGLDVLMRAFASTVRFIGPTRLVVVGRDDGWLAQMHALAKDLRIEDKLSFVGPLFGADVLPAYVDADLFCLTPTHFEETSLASIAALACGTPVLVNERCGIPWLDQYDAGRCVAADERAIAAAMIQILSDEALRARMGAAARRMAEERFFLSSVVTQLESVYQDALKQRATTP